MFFLLLFVVIAIVVAAILIVKNQADQQEEENQREWEEEKAKEEERRIAERLESQREVKEYCEDLNKIYRSEMDAWESRFCSEANPGLKIAGVNKQNLTDRYLGAFKGTLKAESWNAYDSKAVAIYRGKKKVGYVPKEFSAKVFDSLTDGNGVCYGCIYKWAEPGYGDKVYEFFAGKIVMDPCQITEAQ